MINWELLIGLLGIAVSVYFGLNGFSKKFEELRKQVATKYDIIAVSYAFSKSSAEKRPMRFEDIKEGYELAEKWKGI
ncbi:MAG: hypothetical protein ACE5KE_16165 [Methanosarcinales archaeon]